MQQHRHADADRESVHRGDRRLLESRERLHEHQDRRIGLRKPRVGEVLEVVAGGEGAAGTSQHDGAHGAILRRLAKMGDHGLVHRPGNRILLVGAIDRDRRNALIHLVRDAHVSSFAGLQS